jgi:hypothetical protein
MARRFCILLSGLVLFAFVGLSGAYGMDGALDVRARASIGNITDRGGKENGPVEIGESAQSEKKSVAKAMLLSAVVPGLGQAYIGGRWGYATGGVMAAADMFSMWRYFTNTGKGDDKKSEYQAWASDHYSTGRFTEYVRDTIVVNSGTEDFNFGVCTDSLIYDETACWKKIREVFPLYDEGSGAFYEQIGSEDRYIFGWDDWGAGGVSEELWVNWDPRTDLPVGVPTTSANRAIYQGMRTDADDSYGTADRYAWIMVIGRVVSMVDAAIMARLRNRDLAGIGTNPRLTFKAKLGSNPTVKIGLKMRF